MVQTMAMRMVQRLDTNGKYLLCVVQGDIPNPVQYARIASDKSRHTLRRFVEGWLEDSDRIGEFSDDYIDEIVEGMKCCGQFWDDETWCFQVVGDIQEL